MTVDSPPYTFEVVFVIFTPEVLLCQNNLKVTQVSIYEAQGIVFWAGTYPSLFSDINSHKNILPDTFGYCTT